MGVSGDTVESRGRSHTRFTLVGYYIETETDLIFEGLLLQRLSK